MSIELCPAHSQLCATALYRKVPTVLYKPPRHREDIVSADLLRSPNSRLPSRLPVKHLENPAGGRRTHASPCRICQRYHASFGSHGIHFLRSPCPLRQHTTSTVSVVASRLVPCLASCLEMGIHNDPSQMMLCGVKLQARVTPRHILYCVLYLVFAERMQGARRETAAIRFAKAVSLPPQDSISINSGQPPS